MAIVIVCAVSPSAAWSKDDIKWGAQKWGQAKTDRTYICFNRDDALKLSAISRSGFDKAATPLDLGVLLSEAIRTQRLDCLYRELTYFPVSYPTIIEGGKAWVTWDKTDGGTPCGQPWCGASTRFVKSILVFGEKRYPWPVFVSTARAIVSDKFVSDGILHKEIASKP